MLPPPFSDVVFTKTWPGLPVGGAGPVFPAQERLIKQFEYLPAKCYRGAMYLRSRRMPLSISARGRLFSYRKAGFFFFTQANKV